jgi:hypothetical protein
LRRCLDDDVVVFEIPSGRTATIRAPTPTGDLVIAITTSSAESAVFPVIHAGTQELAAIAK